MLRARLEELEEPQEGRPNPCSLAGLSGLRGGLERQQAASSGSLDALVAPQRPSHPLQEPPGEKCHYQEPPRTATPVIRWQRCAWRLTVQIGEAATGPGCLPTPQIGHLARQGEGE